jgi:hypothetical protein
VVKLAVMLVMLGMTKHFPPKYENMHYTEFSAVNCQNMQFLHIFPGKFNNNNDNNNDLLIIYPQSGSSLTKLYKL